MLKKSNHLSAEQLQQLEQLRLACKKVDNSAPNIYSYILENVRAFPASLLYYVQEQLVGFLGAYFFYEDAVEISLFIDPAHRRQGIAKQLIESVLPLIQ